MLQMRIIHEYYNTNMDSNYFYFTLLSLLALVLLNGVKFSKCQELSLRIIIEKRSDLTTLASDRILQNTDVMAYLGNAALRNTVFFAPSNEAFNLLNSKWRLQLFSSNKIVINTIFQYHLVPGINSSLLFNPLALSEGQQIKTLTLHNTYLYATKLDGVCYIDGAKISIPSLSATNGIIHIIDKVFVTDGTLSIGQRGFNGYEFVINPIWDISMMFKQFEDYQLRGSMQQSGIYTQLTETVLRNPMAFCTIFLPYNDFIRKFKLRNQDLYSRISWQTPSMLKQTLESLIIPSGAYHVTLLERLTTDGKTIEAVSGQIRVYMMNDNVYVSNRCGQARILTEDLTTSNCIVHIVDNFLGLVTTDIFNETDKQTDLVEFKRSLYLELYSPLVSNLRAKGGPEYVVPENEKFTLFAPTNEIFRFVDFSANSDERLLQLSMLISRTVVDLSYLSDGSMMAVETMRKGYKATITRVGQNFYVEVNYVKALVVQVNICTSNGLIYKVDRIVGIPDGTIGDYLGRRVELRRLEVVIQETGLLSVCINPKVKVTLFAPNESAVMNLDPMFQGQQNKNKLMRLMYTHISDYAIYLDSLEDGASINVRTYNGVVKVSRSGTEYWVNIGDAKIKVIQGNIGASNGVMHIIERFMPYIYNRVIYIHQYSLFLLTIALSGHTIQYFLERMN